MPRSRIRVVEISFLALLAAMTVALFRVLSPFILDIFLAAVFAGVLYPWFERVARTLGDRRRLASGIVVLLTFVAIAVPATLIGIVVYSEAVDGYASFASRLPEITEMLRTVSLADWLSRIPVIGSYVEGLDNLELSSVIQDAVTRGSNFVISATQRSFVSVTTTLLHFLLVLLLMAFFFASGRRLGAGLYDVLPIPNRELRQIAEETRKTTTATLISTVIIGLIEGSYATVVFLVFGLPSAFLWGIITMILSMIPVIGANLVIVPAGIVLLIGGRVFAGVAVIVLGLGGIATTQNLLKPRLLGSRAGLHPALVLLSTLGGIAWLGLIGFLVGPLVASLCIVVWQQFGRRYRAELDSMNDDRDESQRE